MPSICFTEFTIAGNTVNAYVCQRQRTQNAVNIERQALDLEQMLQSGTIGETPLTSRTYPSSKLGRTVSNYSTIDKSESLPSNTDEHYGKLIAPRKDLLSIVIRTITLVRQNCILQRRVDALQTETQRILRSVLNKSENQRQQDRLQISQLESEIVSSSTDKVVSMTSFKQPRSQPSELADTIRCMQHLYTTP
ncbi:uncharacterized protein LOC105192299 isoform X2 [Harpegnathos saltator]|uniref:uncharacterized protein LOC105192299 isoform X2 n=1 Tax=Harpegnathos saltator TaxID=610380 RepID=UPI0005911560|nr:uncharacterized protein LOC105192299 isoform X2 [Harpegnathos saltator]